VLLEKTKIAVENVAGEEDFWFGHGKRERKKIFKDCCVKYVCRIL